MKSKLPLIQQAFIREHYAQQGAHHCATHLGLTLRQVKWFATSHGLRLTKELHLKIARSNGLRAAAAYKLRYPANIDVNVFSAISSPEAAYTLGLVWADGWIADNIVFIECVTEDIDQFVPVLFKVGTWDRYNRQRINRQPQSRLRTRSQALAAYLTEHGYKTKSHGSACSILDTIPLHLQHYWFRGLIDGDGCFYVGKNRRACHFVLGSSFEQDWTYMEKMLDRLGLRYSIKKTVTPKGHKSSVITLSCAGNIAKLGEWIYQGYPQDEIGLKRKYEKWKLIAEKAERIKTDWRAG